MKTDMMIRRLRRFRRGGFPAVGADGDGGW
jgi:hypothetical protein